MTTSKGSRWFEAALVVLILVMHAYAALSDAYNLPNAWFSRDDAYYYFKVAQNITEGRGVSFDGINLTNGFHPLWMAICIPIFALARYDLILPLRLLLILTAVLQAATAVLLFRLARRALAVPIAALAAAYWAFNPDLHYTFYEFGLETPLAAFAIVGCMYLAARFEDRGRLKRVSPREIAVLALAATAAAFSRLDLAFFAFALGIWLVFRQRPLRVLLPLDLLAILAATSFSQAYIAGFPKYYDHAGSVVAAAVLAMAIRGPIYFTLGLYAHPRSDSAGALVGRAVLAVAASELLLVPALLALQRLGLLAGLSRQGLLLEALLTMLLATAVRLVLRLASTPRPVSSGESPRKQLRSLWRPWLQEGTVYYGVLGGALAIYMAANRLAFGTWLPISAEIKRWWGTQIETIYDGPPRNLFAFFGIGLNSPLDAWKPAADYIPALSRQLRWLLPGLEHRAERDLLVIVLGIAAATALLVIRKRLAVPAIIQMGLLPLFVGAGLQLMSYTALGYAGYKEWYWLPQRLLLTLLAALFLHLLATNVPPLKHGEAIGWALAAGFSATLALGLGRTIYLKMPYGASPPTRPYMEVVTVLEEKTRPGAIIGMTGGGNVGYFIHDRVIVNMDGLINSAGYYRALREGTAASYLSRAGVKVIFANPGLLTLAPYHGQFAPYLERFDNYYGKALLWLLPERKY